MKPKHDLYVYCERTGEKWMAPPSLLPGDRLVLVDLTRMRRYQRAFNKLINRKENKWFKEILTHVSWEPKGSGL